MAGNQALFENPPTGLDIHITQHGSDWYWAAFSLFVLVTLLFTAGAYALRPTNERLFFFNAVFSTFVISIAYYTMASDLGWTGIQAQFNHQSVSPSLATPGIRQIFYARYVGWFLAFPPVILNIAVLAGASITNTFFTILCQEAFVISILIGALIHSSYKWGYFVFGVSALLLVFYQLLFTFRKSVGTGNNYLGYHIGSASLVFFLFIYPIAWALADGGNVISPDSEFIFYGILDVFVFVVINFVFLFTTRNVDFAELGVIHHERALFHEKNGMSFDTHRDQPVSAPITEPVAAPAPAVEPVSQPVPAVAPPIVTPAENQV
ncbi:30 kDa heat shock protein [Trichomonascus vanleenenianus]|uniref:30 kDa heat shock protein n=1 Tax=Trichomonascus vanleenenianus TaxID=2268995 RepID=UPI003ECB0546